MVKIQDLKKSYDERNDAFKNQTKEAAQHIENEIKKLETTNPSDLTKLRELEAIKSEVTNLSQGSSPFHVKVQNTYGFYEIYKKDKEKVEQKSAFTKVSAILKNPIQAPKYLYQLSVGLSKAREEAQAELRKAIVYFDTSSKKCTQLLERAAMIVKTPAAEHKVSESKSPPAPETKSAARRAAEKDKAAAPLAPLGSGTEKHREMMMSIASGAAQVRQGWDAKKQLGPATKPEESASPKIRG